MIRHARNDLELAEQMQDAHKHSSAHKREILSSDICGCFYCLETYPPTEITNGLERDGSMCAICPKCGLNSVIGSASGYPITKEFLTKMRDYWFRVKPSHLTAI